jgi:putative intracellular protease/amidase
MTKYPLSILLFVVLSFSAFGQEILKAIPGDNIVVTLQNEDDHIQWQSSVDGTTWLDLEGKTETALNVNVVTIPLFLRAAISEPRCEVRYSQFIKVERKIILAAIETTSVSSITSTGAVSGGAVTSDGGEPLTEKGIVFGLAPLPTVANSKISSSGGANFNSILQNLSPSTQYYLRAYAVNSAGTAYGQEVNFLTAANPVDVVLPTVTTASITSITASSAMSGGNITSDGGATISGRGIVYGTTPSPTLANSIVQSGSGSGVFESAVNNLTVGTQYFVRAYATNSAGTAYGAERNFTTTSALPVLSGTSRSNLTKNSVTLAASITSGSNISARGFVYALTPAPTLANAQTVNGSNETSFNASASGLATGVVYYVRAFATNDAGTSYGAETSFRTLDSNIILMFVSHEQTYYSEYIVMKKALEASGFVVEVRSSSAAPASIYMLPVSTTISATAATLPGGSHLQFTQQFQNLFSATWDESLDTYPATITVDGRIQDVSDFGPYRAMVVAGGLGALAYRVDGAYAAQGSVSSNDVQQAALKLNSLALNALATGKTVMAQCHASSLPVFWRIPSTSGGGVESLGYSLLKGQAATGFPDADTPSLLQSFGVTHRATNTTDGDRITISSPHSAFNDNGLGDYRIITTRDWYPQTVAHAARTLLNMLGSYPAQDEMVDVKSVLILHGGAVNTSNCGAANRTNDIPCNYGTGAADLPADYTNLQSLLADSPNDEYSFSVSHINISGGGLPASQQDILNYLDDFDVVIFYKHWSTALTPAMLNALVSYADNGGGVLALHHALYNDLDGSQNKDIIIDQLFGAASPPWASLAEANRTTYRLFNTNYGHFISTFAMPLTPSNISIEAPAPWQSTALSAKANAGFSYYHNFQLFDEIYNPLVFKAGVTFGRNVNEITPMFSNNQNPSTQSHTAGFVRLFNQSGSDVGRVAYFQPGENKANYSQSSIYGQVIRNAIVWLSN